MTTVCNQCWWSVPFSNDHSLSNCYASADRASVWGQGEPESVAPGCGSAGQGHCAWWLDRQARSPQGAAGGGTRLPQGERGFLLLVFLGLLCQFVGKLGSPYLVRHSSCKSNAAQSFIGVCIISCVQTVVCLPVFGIFNMHTDVDACTCTWGLYGHCDRVCSES